jgi:hypothetical protein
MHPRVSRFMLAALAGAGLALPAAAQPQDKLEVVVGGTKYVLPAVGAAADPKAAPIPVDPATLATIETWRAFAWDAAAGKYRYRFGAAATTSAVTVLTADAAVGEYAKSLDAAALRVADYVGADRLRKNYVAIVCATQEEYERAAEFASARALELAPDELTQNFLRDQWLTNAKQNATFYQELAGIVGCVEGNSEKGSPEHEIVRGFAVVAMLGHSPQLWHALPFLIGLSWNAEYDVLGDILSMPYGDEFQFDIGRGTWSASKLAAVVKKAGKAVEKEHGREVALRDLPYLSRGEGSTADAAAVAWASSRHLIRHHAERLPAFLSALSAEVVAANTVVRSDGSTSYELAPGYQLGWETIEKVLAATITDYRFVAHADCIATACADCKAWAKERGIR